MIGIKFYPKTYTEKGTVSVMVEVKKDSQKVRKSTGITIDVKHWDRRAQRPLRVSALSSKDKKDNFLKTKLGQNRTLLDSLDKRIKDEVSNDKLFLINGTLPIELVEAVIEDFKGKPQRLKRLKSGIQSNMGLTAFIREFVSDMETGKTLQTNAKRYSIGTIRQWRSWSANWQSFEAFYSPNKSIQFEDITERFYKEFLAFFYQERDMQIETVGRMVKNLKAIMNRALREKMHDNLDYKFFQKPSMKKTVVKLTEDEVRRLYELDLSDSALEKYRDVFLVGCYTALRISDLGNLSKENLYISPKGRHFLKVKMKKTRDEVTVPIYSEICQSILEKYDYCLPRFSDQKLNMNIKKIAEKAGITYDVKIATSVRGIERDITVPKHHLICSHTGRRTGASMLIAKGMPTNTVMKFTGHKTEESLRRYINVEEMERIAEMEDNPLLWS